VFQLFRRDPQCRDSRPFHVQHIRARSLRGRSGNTKQGHSGGSGHDMKAAFGCWHVRWISTSVSASRATIHHDRVADKEIGSPRRRPRRGTIKTGDEVNIIVVVRGQHTKTIPSGSIRGGLGRGRVPRNPCILGPPDGESRRDPGGLGPRKNIYETSDTVRECDSDLTANSAQYRVCPRCAQGSKCEQLNERGELGD